MSSAEVERAASGAPAPPGSRHTTSRGAASRGRQPWFASAACPRPGVNFESERGGVKKKKRAGRREGRSAYGVRRTGSPRGGAGRGEERPGSGDSVLATFAWELQPFEPALEVPPLSPSPYWEEDPLCSTIQGLPEIVKFGGPRSFINGRPINSLHRAR